MGLIRGMHTIQITDLHAAAATSSCEMYTRAGNGIRHLARVA